MYTVEEPLTSFNFWSGAEETVKHLTTSDIEIVESCLNDLYPNGLTDTMINDFFWFERDCVAQCLGYEDWDELLADRD